MSQHPIRYIVRYTGHVHGVCFRATAVSESSGLDVHGFVRNESDGSVRMDVEGSPAAVKELMRRIASSMSGHIDGTDVDQRPPLGESRGFRIRY